MAIIVPDSAVDGCVEFTYFFLTIHSMSSLLSSSVFITIIYLVGLLERYQSMGPTSIVSPNDYTNIGYINTCRAGKAYSALSFSTFSSTEN